MELERSVILLVDDDGFMRELIGNILRPQNDVIEADSVSEGLRQIESGRVDLVLLDVMMPDVDGYEGCRLIKAQAKGRGDYLPVLLLTALNAQDDRNRGLEAGADDFLSKPINRVELVLRVQTFLRLRWHEQHLREQILTLRTGDALKDDLVSLLVHDLRNPLCGIAGVLESMTESTIDESWRNDVKAAVTASAELKELLEDILHVKRFESGAMELKREPTEVNSVVADALASLGGAARARAVHLVRVAGPPVPSFSADRKLLRRALENLLSNAIRYSPCGGEVSVNVKDAAGAVEIEVTDTGVGVPGAFKKELFSKFGSVEAANGGIRRGFGLGLYMVDLVARAHGGQATVRDHDGGGSTFGIAVPRQAAAPLGH
jgi:two-component system sensor histidine kinase/response regulator